MNYIKWSFGRVHSSTFQMYVLYAILKCEYTLNVNKALLSVYFTQHV